MTAIALDRQQRLLLAAALHQLANDRETAVALDTDAAILLNDCVHSARPGYMRAFAALLTSSALEDPAMTLTTTDIAIAAALHQLANAYEIGIPLDEQGDRLLAGIEAARDLCAKDLRRLANRIAEIRP